MARGREEGVDIGHFFDAFDACLFHTLTEPKESKEGGGFRNVFATSSLVTGK